MAPLKPPQRPEYLASVDRRRLALPDGKRIAVFLVVNVGRWDIDRPMPRQVLTVPQGAKAMGIAVHPHISGVPHRIGWIEKALDYMGACPGTLFWQARQIMDCYLGATA
jgi:hypothetical protein